MNREEQLKQITYQLADVNFYREPERFSELFNEFIQLSQEHGLESWKNKLTCSLPLLGCLEPFPLFMLL